MPRKTSSNDSKSSSRRVSATSQHSIHTSIINNNKKSASSSSASSPNFPSSDTASQPPHLPAIPIDVLNHIQTMKQTVLHVLLVQFHHKHGPQVEYVHPPFPPFQTLAVTSLDNPNITISGDDPKESSTSHLEDRDTSRAESPSATSTGSSNQPACELPAEWNFLPFLCLPDGAHGVDEDFIYFHLPPVPGWASANFPQSTLFGLACFRQLDSKELVVKTADVTRSRVQKAVVVLAKDPILNLIRDKLRLTTQALFAQRDFSKLDILNDLYDNITSLSTRDPISDSSLYMGISLREMVFKFRTKILQLFKLFLLEKRILFFGNKVEKVCLYQYGLVALIPELLRNLRDVGSPALAYEDVEFDGNTEHTSSTTNALRYKTFGLPLRIFGQGAFFQPYIPLQQMDVLTSSATSSFLVGTSNIIFTHKSSMIDAVVNVDQGTIEIADPVLASHLVLTAADKRFMEEITKSVLTTWGIDGENADGQQINYEGSDEHVRARFEEYLLSLMACIKSADNASSYSPSIPGAKPKDLMVDFGHIWVSQWQTTNNFVIWDRTTSSSLTDQYRAEHPFAGTTALGAMQASFANKMTEMKLDRAISNTSNQLKEGQQKLFANMSSWYEKRRREWNMSNDGGKYPEKASSITSLALPSRSQTGGIIKNDGQIATLKSE